MGKGQPRLLLLPLQCRGLNQRLQARRLTTPGPMGVAALRHRQIPQALQRLLGLLQQGVLAVAGQGPVLLGIAGPRQGPKPRASAAAERITDTSGMSEFKLSNEAKPYLTG